ncbi:MAG: hypothetical protein V4717_05520 [Bacteroidota bacterium]
MKAEENRDEDLEREDEKQSGSRSTRQRRDRKMMLEQEIVKVSQDEMLRAREIVMIRKELNRLHFKVKNYHNQTRLVNAIIQIVIVILLLVIIYRLYEEPVK